MFKDIFSKIGVTTEDWLDDKEPQCNNKDVMNESQSPLFFAVRKQMPRSLVALADHDEIIAQKIEKGVPKQVCFIGQEKIS